MRKRLKARSRPQRKPSRFPRLRQVFDRLHGPRGCLWDKRQSHSSILPSLREEVDEFIHAVRSRNARQMQEELGDILLHVMFHARLAEKSGSFDIEDVIAGLIAKLKRRHPHVFGNTKVSSVKEIVGNWERIKRREKAGAVRR